jgi:hypothetical protein
MLRMVKITHDWAGPIDRTSNSLPIFGQLYGDANIHYGVGWSGNGVGPSVVGGKILASLALGYYDEWSGCGLVTDSVGSFPPEPIRFAGAHIVKEAIVRKRMLRHSRSVHHGSLSRSQSSPRPVLKIRRTGLNGGCLLSTSQTIGRFRKPTGSDAFPMGTVSGMEPPAGHIA